MSNEEDNDDLSAEDKLSALKQHLKETEPEPAVKPRKRHARRPNSSVALLPIMADATRQEMDERILELLKDQKTESEVLEICRHQFPHLDAPRAVTKMYEALALAATPFNIRKARAQISLGVAHHYQEATRNSSLELISEALKDPELSPALKQRMIMTYDPERARSNALKALEIMAKLHGVFSPDKVEITNRVDDMSPEARALRIAELSEKLVSKRKKGEDE